MSLRRFCLVLFLLPISNGVFAGPLAVMVSIPPQAYLAERIGGDRVDVTAMVRPGDDPHLFEPSPQQMMALGKARLYFTIGFPFESVLLARISGGYPNLRIVDSTAGVARRILSEPHCHDHGDHEHGAACSDDEGADPHVWLDPERIKVIAGNMTKALSEASPGDSAHFESNHEALCTELDAADRAIRSQLAPHAGRTFFVFHPAFGYFADRYGLIQKAVEIEGKSPTPRQLQALIAEAREHHAKTIFVQPQFDAKSAETIAKAIGGKVEALDDLARDVIANLHGMADAIAGALSP